MSVSERVRTEPAVPGAPFRSRDGTAWGSGLVALVAGLRRRPAGSPWPVLLDAMVVGCLAALLGTGVLLMLVYTPSSTLVHYHGSYPLLRGTEMSQAYASTLQISFDVRGGLLVRQAHHWAALLLPAALMIRMLISFFTGAFRRPRRLHWLLLAGAYLMALLGGWSGYALPDDLLAGTGLRIFHGVVLGIPVVGTWASLLIFGGEYPGDVLARLYPVHVVVAPVVLVLALLARFLLAYRDSPRMGRDPRPTKPESELGTAGAAWWPTTAVRAAAMIMITLGTIILFGGLVEISPVWRQGPSSPGAAGAGSQPDWYTAFLDGALRLVPSGWEVQLGDRTLTLAVIVPLLVTGGLILAVLAWPFIEELGGGDRTGHPRLDRARDVPTRTALGVAGLVCYGTLWAAGSADLIATEFAVSFNAVITVLQVIICAGPVLGFLIARSACRTVSELERERRQHGTESGVIVRLPGGGYVEASPAPARASLPAGAGGARPDSARLLQSGDRDR